MCAGGEKIKGGVRRLILWFMRHYYSCDIPLEAAIADDVIFQHSALGVVISKYAIVESGVTIMHGVTLGASKGLTNAPIIHRDAILGASCTIVGKVEVGEGSIVGAGAIVTKDVPPHHTVIGVNKIIPISDEMKKVIEQIQKKHPAMPLS